MKTIETYESNAVVDPGGSVRVQAVPFASGDYVRVFVMHESSCSPRRHSEADVQLSRMRRHGLKGTVIRYDRPTDPVGEEDWDVR